jgi:hypothetical protein
VRVGLKRELELAWVPPPGELAFLVLVALTSSESVLLNLILVVPKLLGICGIYILLRISISWSGSDEFGMLLESLV